MYNHFLGELKKQYETTGYIHVNIPSRNLEELRAKVPWLKETNQNCQENAISDMKVAVRKFLSLKKQGSDSNSPASEQSAASIKAIKVLTSEIVSKS